MSGLAAASIATVLTLTFDAGGACMALLPATTWFERMPDMSSPLWSLFAEHPLMATASTSTKKAGNADNWVRSLIMALVNSNHLVNTHSNRCAFMLTQKAVTFHPLTYLV